MPGPQTPAVASVVLPPISSAAITDQNGHLTPAGLNLFQQIWAGVFGTGGVATNYPQPGDLKPIGGSGAQAGWLTCDGTAYNQQQYLDLYNAIGTAWGSAGAGTFRVPDLRGKFPIGADGTHVLGASGGQLSITIDKVNLPSYSLSVTDPGHIHTVTDPGHVHTALTAASTNTAGGAAGSSTAGNTGSAVTGISIDAAVTGISVDSGGSGGSIDTTPTYGAINWLIKT